MSFLYPRTVTITRPNSQTGAGNLSYGGVTRIAETTIASSLPASIQIDRAGKTNQANLPADAKQTEWRIFIPASAAQLGLIKTRDVVTDDQGVRYNVSAPYWNSLGYQLRVERLEL